VILELHALVWNNIMTCDIRELHALAWNNTMTQYHMSWYCFKQGHGVL
jgi:hypothetical protein